MQNNNEAHKIILRKYQAGTHTKVIAADLNGMGLTLPSGKPWQSINVSNVANAAGFRRIKKNTLERARKSKTRPRSAGVTTDTISKTVSAITEIAASNLTHESKQTMIALLARQL